jgi:DNA-binding transcriptional LysR family regulator
MQSHNLNTLLWVVRLGSLSAAADHLHLTQSAVTRRIQELERDLKVKLFQRAGRLITPTTAAQAMLPAVERVLQEIATMRAAALGGSAYRGKVRIGIAELIGLTWFDRLLMWLDQDFPNLAVEIRVDVSGQLIEGLSRHSLDVAFLPGSALLKGLVQSTIGSRALRWVGHPRLIATHDALSPQTIADLPIILLPKGADWYDIAMVWFAEAKLKPSRVSTCNSLSVLTSLVRKGVGISLMPVDLIVEELANGSLVAIPEYPTLPRADYSAAYLPSDDAPIIPQIVAYATTLSQSPDTSGSMRDPPAIRPRAKLRSRSVLKDGIPG